LIGAQIRPDFPLHTPWLVHTTWHNEGR